MAIEQLNLISIRRLIDKTWELKRELHKATTKLEVAESERNKIKIDLKEKNEYFNNEISNLKSQYNESLKDKEDKFTREKELLVENYEKKLKISQDKMQKENDSLSKSLDKLSKENNAIVNRIIGVEQ